MTQGREDQKARITGVILKPTCHTIRLAAHYKGEQEGLSQSTWKR